jgi:hypothetical protein
MRSLSNDEKPRAPATPPDHDAATTSSDDRTAVGDDPTAAPGNDTLERSPFPHPPWTVGLVLVAGGITLLFGILVNPIWLVVGSPFVLALFLWLYVRLFVRP